MNIVTYNGIVQYLFFYFITVLPVLQVIRSTNYDKQMFSRFFISIYFDYAKHDFPPVVQSLRLKKSKMSF